MKFLFSVFLLLVLAFIPVCFAEVVLKDTQGQSTTFAALKGKWVLINYWAAWCQSCVDEIPELNSFYQSHKHEPVALYGINFDKLPLSKQKKLIKRFNIHYPNLLQDPAAELNLGDITGLPITFVFNPQGELVKKLYGTQTVEKLNQSITVK